jgi:hypothetical protein
VERDDEDALTPDDLKSVGALIDMLATKGVTEFSGHGVRIRLGAAPEAATPLEPEKPYCKCGCPPWEHNGAGECLKGCATTTCFPEKT